MSCVGSVSNAGLNVRPSETINCTILSLDNNGLPTYATPVDFLAPLVTGGLNISAITQFTPMVLKFTVVSTPLYDATMDLQGRLADGTNFTQGPVTLLIGNAT